MEEVEHCHAQSPCGADLQALGQQRPAVLQVGRQVRAASQHREGVHEVCLDLELLLAMCGCPSLMNLMGS